MSPTITCILQQIYVSPLNKYLSKLQSQIPRRHAFRQPYAVSGKEKGIPVPAHPSAVHQIDHRVSVPSSHRFRRFPVPGQMHIQPAFGDQALRVDAFRIFFARSVVQDLRRLLPLQFHVHRDGMALIRAELRPVFIEGIALLVVSTDNLLLLRHGQCMPRRHAGQQGVHLRPAVGIQGNPSHLGLMAQHQA